MDLNPQQLAFKEAYCNPNSPTFGNATQSAIAAGYEESYADNLLSLRPAWLSVLIGDVEMMQDAEKALKESLNLDIRNGGEKVDSAIAGIKLKAGMFTSERLMKQKYSQKTEVEGNVKVEASGPMTPEMMEAAKVYEEAMKKALLKK